MLPLRYLLLVLVTALSASPPFGAQAADWDHDENIAAGVQELAGIYKADGAVQAANAVRSCYGSLPDLSDSDERLRRLEYCAGMDYAGYLIGRGSQDAGVSAADGFFAAPNVRERLTALQQFVTDPLVQNQILQAWGVTAADALREHMR
jgi:hypothetical protein